MKNQYIQFEAFAILEISNNISHEITIQSSFSSFIPGLRSQYRRRGMVLETENTKRNDLTQYFKLPLLLGSILYVRLSFPL